MSFPHLSSSSPTRGITVPSLLLLSFASAALLLFLLLPSLSPSCHCPVSTPVDQISTTQEDISWLNSLIQRNALPQPPSSAEEWLALRKGINPRSRDKQLEDFREFRGISHYENGSRAPLPCPGELLVEEHHSYYGEPWAGGRDVFEFLATAVALSPSHSVLEVGCGTLRVGLHFIRHLAPGRFHCLEQDNLSLLAALRYELPSHGLLHKRPLILRGNDMDFSRFGDGVVYDLIYASAVFLHVKDDLVWVAFGRLAERLRPETGRIFVSHNLKFCTRLKEECKGRLDKIGLELVGQRTHDSLLFNHYEIWYEFRRTRRFVQDLMKELKFLFELLGPLNFKGVIKLKSQ